MARVFLTSGLSRHTGGVDKLDVDGTSVRELIAALERQFPGVGEVLTSGVAVAIDGEIVHDAIYEPVPDDAEVHFLPAVSGG